MMKAQHIVPIAAWYLFVSAAIGHLIVMVEPNPIPAGFVVLASLLWPASLAGAGAIVLVQSFLMTVW